MLLNLKLLILESLELLEDSFFLKGFLEDSSDVGVLYPKCETYGKIDSIS
jgi:hypothetical protein